MNERREIKRLVLAIPGAQAYLLTMALILLDTNGFENAKEFCEGMARMRAEVTL